MGVTFSVFWLYILIHGAGCNFTAHVNRDVTVVNS